MLFNSYEFIFLFLPLVLVLYYAMPRNGKGQLLLLTVASYVFYGWWNPPYCLVILGISVFDYGVGRELARATHGRRALLAASIVANLGLLAVFKYAGFFARSVNAVAGTELLRVLEITLPIGISFHTFQSMSYTIDVYRGATKPARSLLEFLCFVAFFPQLVAGPIVRYAQISDELASREHSYEKAARGVWFFVNGLAKKVLVADSLARLAEGLDAAPVGLWASWLAVTGYACQIYFDFSGYSDMAVGLGALFGFDFPPNFDSPYQSRSITEFWRRWHISLSSWLRDYLYIPLGGSQKGSARTYANLMVTMLLGGLWHGASWNFVLWGAWHGALLAAERALGERNPIRRLPHALQVAITFALVLGGWVFFRAPTLELARAHLLALVGHAGAGSLPGTFAPLLLKERFFLPVALGVAFFATNTWRREARLDRRVALFLVVLFLGSVVALLTHDGSPFLYFQF